MRLWSIGANEWRIEWSLRTCLSVAASAALALYTPTQRTLNNYGNFEIGPPFGCFVCIIVKDNTIGGSIANAWGCLYGSFVACLVGYVFEIMIGNAYNIPAAVLLTLLFTFSLNYVEFHAMGKKLGLSILALNLLVIHPEPINNWILFLNVIMGILTGLIGNLFPWPRLASQQVEGRALFCSETMSCILADIAVSWRYAAVPISTVPLLHSIRHKSTNNYDSNLYGITVNIDPSPTFLRKSWSLIRNVILAISAFKNKQCGMNWTNRYGHHRNNVHMRLELSRFIDEDLAYMQTMCAEARFGPNRGRAIVRYEHYCVLIRDLQIIVALLETRLRDVRSHAQQHHVFFAFQSRPAFRAAVEKFMICMGASLNKSAEWLSELKNSPSEETIKSLKALRSARDDLDDEYIRSRVDIYYNEDEDMNKPMTSFVAMNQNSFMMLFDSTFFVLSRYWSNFITNDLQYVEESIPSWTTYLSSMVNSMCIDLFPRQAHLFRLTNGKLSPYSLFRLKQSISLSVAMCIAGIYGFYVGRQEVFMAAFTIAYLSGGVVSGANAITSLNRASGTVAGSVYAVIIAYIVDNWGRTQASIFIFFALLIFQLPCTYIRSLPLYGYSGTVAAFTAAVLLLMPTINQREAIDRIIDTYVGVFIFLILDTVISPSYSDDALLTDVYKVFRNIKDHFKEFITMFKSQSESSSDIILPRSLLIVDISHGKDVSLFSSSIPVPWRPPPLEKRIIDELISGSESAHRSIQGMIWALVVCRREDKSDFSYLLRPLRGQLDKVADFVESVSAFLQSNVDHMRNWQLLQGSSHNCSIEMLVNGEHATSDTSALSNRLALLSTGEEESSEVLEFFTLIEELILSLQGAFKESTSYRNLFAPLNETSESRLKRVLDSVISNEEVKSVNGVLACTKDLVEALRTISSSMTRLRAYRDIRLTQSGSRRRRHL